MKKLFLILTLISSEGWAKCFELNNIENELKAEKNIASYIYRCEIENDICYLSRVSYGYSVSCFPKPKSK